MASRLWTDKAALNSSDSKGIFDNLIDIGIQTEGMGPLSLSALDVKTLRTTSVHFDITRQIRAELDCSRI